MSLKKLNYTTVTVITVLFFWVLMGRVELVAQPKNDPQKAKEHFFKAKELIEQGAWKKAIVELQASYELNPVPLVLFNIAVCYDKLTEYAEASNYYRKFLATAKDAPLGMRKEAENRIKELRKFLGLVNLSISGFSAGEEAGAEVIIDGNLAGVTPIGPFFLETGEHEVIIRKEGYFEAKKRFKVVSGEETNVELKVVRQVVVEEKKTAEVSETKKPEEKKPAEVTPTKQIEKSEGIETQKVSEINRRKDLEVKEGKEEFLAKPEGGKKKLTKAPFGVFLGLTLALGVTSTVTGVMALKKDREVAGMYENENWKGLRKESDNLALATDILMGFGVASAITTVILALRTEFKKEKTKKVSFFDLFLKPCNLVVCMDKGF